MKYAQFGQHDIKHTEIGFASTVAHSNLSGSNYNCCTETGLISCITTFLRVKNPLTAATLTSVDRDTTTKLQAQGCHPFTCLRSGFGQVAGSSCKVGLALEKKVRGTLAVDWKSFPHFQTTYFLLPCWNFERFQLPLPPIKKCGYAVAN